MADTWLTPDKKKDLLSYIEEGANEEDLYAAGFTKDNLAEVGWGEPVKFSAGPHHPEATTPQGTIEPYTPTRRENLRHNVEGLLTTFGAPEGAASSIATSVAGNEATGPGIADFTPLGLVFGAEEGTRQIKRGIKGGNASDIGFGALNLGLSAAEAIPGAGAIVKGLGKLASKMVKEYDPTMVNIFYNAKPEDAQSAQYLIDRGFSRDEVAMRTGLWQDPTSKRWLAETDDKAFQINPQALKYLHSDKNPHGAMRGPTKQVLPHKQLYDLFPSIGEDKASIVKATEAKKYFGDDDTLGTYTPSTNSLRLKETADRKVALHELQHAVDSLQGEDAGASPRKVYHDLSSLYDNLRLDDKYYLSMLSEVEASKTALSDLYKLADDEASKGWRYTANLYSNEEIQSAIEDAELDLLMNQRGMTSYEKVNPNLAKSLKDLYSVTQIARPSAENSFYAYVRNAGEDLANLTMERADLDAYERLMKDPWKESRGKTWTQRELTGALNNVQTELDRVRTGSSYRDELLNLPYGE